MQLDVRLGGCYSHAMTVISLMTDFGLKDGNVGVMKGVILGIAPAVQIVDISHFIPPQDLRQAALILARTLPYFPPGAIHVTVIDPGVGTARRPMAARLGDQCIVGPDNGLISMGLEHAEQAGWPVEFYRLDQPQFWLPEVSHVFHGRDIFAPVAAHLANGTPLAALGTPFHDPVRLVFPQPKRTASGWQGEVIHIDHFGNLACNIRLEHLASWLQQPAALTVQIKQAVIRGMVQTFGDRAPGDLTALFGSTGNLIVAVVNGSAAERLGVQPGESVTVTVNFSHEAGDANRLEPLSIG